LLLLLLVPLLVLLSPGYEVNLQCAAPQAYVQQGNCFSSSVATIAHAAAAICGLLLPLLALPLFPSCLLLNRPRVKPRLVVLQFLLLLLLLLQIQQDLACLVTSLC